MRVCVWLCEREFYMCYSYWFTIQWCSPPPPSSSSLSYITYKNVECHMHTQLNWYILYGPRCVWVRGIEFTRVDTKTHFLSSEWENWCRIEIDCLQRVYFDWFWPSNEIEIFWNEFGCVLSLSLFLSVIWNWFFFLANEKNSEPDTKWSYVSNSSNKRAVYTNIKFECDDYLSFIRIYENEKEIKTEIYSWNCNGGGD